MEAISGRKRSRRICADHAIHAQSPGEPVERSRCWEGASEVLGEGKSSKRQGGCTGQGGGACFQADRSSPDGAGVA